jgi:hypothetical protein
MEKDSIKSRIANQRGCVSRCDANKTIFAIRHSARKLKAMTRDEFAKLGNWDDINKAYSEYEAVMEAMLLAVEHEMEGYHNEQ